MSATADPLGVSPLDDDARLTRKKQRVYVLGQSLGWFAFLALQAFFGYALLPRKASVADQMLGFSILVFIVALGWLITHFSRVLIARWGWKSLGWRALVSRIALMSAAQSAVWSLVGYGYPYLVLRLPWSGKLPFLLAVFASWMNGMVVLGAWLAGYFFYHVLDRYSRLQINLKDAELRALKSQINPHFIFNSLNSLRALIEEEPARARQAVTQLANLLRYSLQSGQLEVVPFEDELRVVSDYLALEQIRHEERLRVRLDIAPETLGLSIPPLLLQTLVENAVKYGISTRAEGGEIAIVARRENDALRLQVSNPGELAPAHAAKTAKSASTGLGLRNAAERLRLLFGERAKLELRVGAPTLVIAEAILPAAPLRA